MSAAGATQTHHAFIVFANRKGKIMQTSARNQIQGHVHAVLDGSVNSEVIVDIGGGEQLAAIITKESADRLGLAAGKPVTALIKASWPILVAGALPRTSARNHLCGTVKAVKAGPVNTEIVLGLKGGAEFVTIVTTGSETALDLKVGDEACALVKASHVILAI